MIICPTNKVWTYPDTPLQQGLERTGPRTWAGLAFDPCRDWVRERDPVEALLECKELDWMGRLFECAFRLDSDFRRGVLILDAQQRGARGQLEVEDCVWRCNGEDTYDMEAASRAMGRVFDLAQSWAYEHASPGDRDKLTMRALKHQIRGALAIASTDQTRACDPKYAHRYPHGWEVLLG